MNVKGHGKVPYQKPQLKVYNYGVYDAWSTLKYSAMHSPIRHANSTQLEQSIRPFTFTLTRGVLHILIDADTSPCC